MFELLSTQHQEGKKDTWIRHTFTFTPEGGGTTVTKKVVSEPGFTGALIRFIASPGHQEGRDDLADQPEDDDGVEGDDRRRGLRMPEG